MAKKVFFSFHYQDVIDFRANVVRNHGNFKLNKDEAGFYDSSIWEEAKKTSNIALKRLINKGIQNTSNTCVLVGTETFQRPWVRYELLKSFKKGNHILAVHINGIKCKNAKTKNLGKNPLNYVGIYAKDKNSYHLIYKESNQWYYYTEIDGTSKINIKHSLDLNTNIPLSKFYKIYKWNADDGYNNFKDWVK
jgi:hypothetical protein